MTFAACSVKVGIHISTNHCLIIFIIAIELLLFAGILRIQDTQKL